MIKFFSKLGKKITFFILSFLFITLIFTCVLPKTYAASSNIYYVTTSVGETYETAGINYHCNLEGSYVIFSTSSSLTNFTKVEPTSTKWHIDQNEDDPSTGFEERYVCRAQLTNLLPSTTYYYQIICGNEKSDIYSFKTGNTSSNSVLFLTDTQSAKTSYFQKVNTLVQAIESKEKNLNMVIMTGDIVDRGGYKSQWDAFFEGMPILQKYQQATIPGNHEYYHDNDSKYIDASIYNQFYYNPQNGPDDRINSSYYFIYGQTLYIMLDILNGTKAGIDIEAQKTWFREVVKNNPTRWIIVGSHAGAISAGAYASDAKYLWNNFHDVFEECQVDLCISGHEHIYIRKDLSYQGKKNEELGVTYLVGPAAGAKDYAAQTTEGLDKVVRGNYRGHVLKFQGSKLTVSLYDTNGKVVESFELTSKRNGEIQEFTDEEILDSVQCEYDATTNSAVISWEQNLWGVVQEVKCSGDATWSRTIPSCAEYFSKYTLNNIFETNNYHYTLTFIKTDGTTLTKDVALLLNKDLTPSNISISGKRYINVEGTTQLTAKISPDGAEQSVTWRSDNPNIATVDENGLVTGVSEGQVKIYATSTLNPSVYRYNIITVTSNIEPTKLEITGVPNNITKGDTFTLNINYTPTNSTKSVTWTSSDESIATVVDGVVTILDYGTVTITVTSNKATNVTTSIELTSKEAKQNSCGCGCNSNTNIGQLIALSSALGLSIILLRKKK